MTNNSPIDFESNDDDLFIGWLSPLDEDAAAFPPEFADRVAQMGGELFAESTRAPSPQNPIVSPSDSPAPLPRQRSMIAKVLVALSALFGTVTWFISQDPVSADVTLGSILDRTSEAKSLQLRVTRAGQAADVWVKRPGQIRWEESSTRYRIATGTQLWQINEETNTYRKDIAHWFDESEREVDLLSLVGIEGREAARFREATPAEQILQDGKRCQVFRFTAEHRQPPVVIEAIAEAETGALHSLAVWPAGKRQGAPLAELALVARDVAVDDSKFVVAESLSEDGRIGKLTDAQGIVTLQPKLVGRWTPVCRQMLLKPGDWLRTDVRGANAVTAALTSKYQIIVGPGSLVELQDPHRLKLHGGEVKISGTDPKGPPLTLIGPREKTRTVAAGTSVHYRMNRQEEFEELKEKPQWLAGYEGSTTQDSLGSLIAKIDGRDVPLSVGYHKVKVEIRDQIARTTIEESFVNRTNETLEGIFHFPLPQDASISGFGMWINGELIEADVVEKQRAREIYETILREKRDPGLLEWTGGNIFKARVFPIPARSEKRIQIVYTQVLPLRGNRYRYSYGLRSELLRTAPVRELSLDVQIHSALPLKSVDCPTHPVRSQLAEHSAKLEFAAQEYTPERDFEVVCEVDSRKSDVVVIPHQRGEDGYFLVQLTPPAGEGNWQREILPDGSPLELLLICDTSASMDSEKRREQEEFVAAVLSSLGAKDRFNLAVCDVDCQWYSEDWIAQDQEAIAKARAWLHDRISLGWTNLERMTESVLKRLTPQTHVVYIGDGIVTSGATDPQEFANRFQRMTDKKRTGLFHAVAVGNSFESTVLKAMTGAGGGSLRQIGGEQTPQRTAFELLNEIAQPGLKNLKVEFRGIQVAAIYPDKLPNLAAGTQQILIGRYLPQGENQSGEILISGERNGETVRFASRITLANAAAGNSFIPRLWARAHLDHLMAQGSSAFIKDQIIALSEEFHIITPYTSLLVLESDKDRERFGVKRRYQMRDGERFFAEGRDQSHMELLQQQMKLAGDWRLNLRRQVLAQFATLGRNANLFAQLHQYLPGFPGSRFDQSMSSLTPLGAAPRGDIFQRGGFIGGGAGGAMNSYNGGEFYVDMLAEESDEFGLAKDLGDLPLGNEYLTDRIESAGWDFENGEVDLKLSLPDKTRLELWDPYDVDGAFAARSRENRAEHGYFLQNPGWDGLTPAAGPAGAFLRPSKPNGSSGYLQWISQLFPNIPPPPAPPAEKPPVKWKGEAFRISQSLIQPLAVKTGGLEITQRIESRSPAWNRMTGLSNRIELYSPKQWLHFTENAGSQTYIEWATPQERGMASRAFELGQVRPSVPRDLDHQPGNRPYAVDGLHETYRDYAAAVEKPRADRAVLTMTYGTKPQTDIIATIDTDRRVLLELEWRINGKMTSRTTYSNFQQGAGVWWPGRIETFDDKSRITSITTQTVKPHSQDAFGDRFAEEVPKKQQYRLLSLPLPSLRDADKAVANGAADFEDRLILLVRNAWNQQWDAVFEQLKAMEQIAGDQRGMGWVRVWVLLAARKNEEARQLLQTLADQIIETKPADEFFLAGYVLDRVNDIADANEQLRILNRLQPVFDRQPDHADAGRSWSHRKTQLLRNLGRIPEAMALQKILAETAPWDVWAQTAYARDLANAGDYKAAYAWLRQEIERKAEREEYEVRQLRDAYAEMLRNQGRDQDLIAFFKEWIETNPTEYQVYQRYLSALIEGNRLQEADETAKQWLAAGRVPGILEPDRHARLNAAVYYALGQRYYIHMNWIEPKWLEPLKEIAIFCLEHEHLFPIASQIIDAQRFGDTDENDEIKDEVARRLKNFAQTLPPARLSNFVNWVIDHDALSEAEWTQIAETLRKRWDAEGDSTKRYALGDVLLQIHAHHFPETRQLPFLRDRIARAEKEDEPDHAAQQRRALFQELLRREWKAEYETEAFALIERLTYQPYWGQTSESISQRLIAQIQALHQFVDRMLEARYQAEVKHLQEQGHPEDLTRTELSKKLAELQQSAREGVAKLLANRLDAKPNAPQAQREPEATKEWLQWVRLERMYLDLRLERIQNQVATECWAMLGEKPPLLDDSEFLLSEQEIEAERREAIEALRKQRAFVMVNYLAVRKSASPDLLKQLKDYIAAGLEYEGDAAAPWKDAQFALLVALDQPEELERQLSNWIRTDPFPAPWQLALGRLLAEQGKIEAAITLFEAVKRAGRLSSSDYAGLARWYLVVERKAEYRRAKIEVFKTLEEYQISNWISQKRQPWQQSGAALPSELDEEVLFAFQAVFEKSNRPENYLYELREFYTASRDFRLLQMLPDALTGRTPQQIYSFLEYLKSSVLHEIRKEATADEILKRIAEVRAASKSSIDLRALDLLEALIERQAADVLNQPEPHIEAALAALRRAFEREWAEGEVRQMAEFLDLLDTIKQPELNVERLRQLRALHRLTEPGTEDRLFVAWHLAHALFSSHNEREEAISVMQIAIREFENANPTDWPAHANTPLDGAADLLEAAKRFSEAEELLTRHIENPRNPTQKHWLLNRQNECYLEALNEDGLVSLGEGATLYRNLTQHLLKQLKTIADENHRYQTVFRLLDVFRAAKRKEFAYQADLKEFASEELPEVLKSQMHNYSNLVDQTSEAMRELLGPREALEFLIVRYENYPKRYEYSWESAWQRLSSRLGSWREEVKNLDPELEKRLLAIVLEELRRDLRTQYSRSRYLYAKHHHFWEAKADEFARVANEVLKEREDSGRAVAYIASYFYDGLERHNRAIEILLAAYDRKVLDTAQQILLCEYLIDQRRFAESIPILQPIMDEQPDVMRYRSLLMISYFRSDRHEQMRQLLAETDAHFRKEGRWTESNIATLAEACLNTGLFAEAVAYYEEAISRHQRTAPNQGIGGDTLSQYYSNQAQAYSGLGQTQKAVDAAAAAVVAWGPNQEDRQTALHELKQVFVETKDLDEYIKSYDQKVEKEKQDSPVIRQKMGEVYMDRGEQTKAITQFEKALELQPNNVEVHNHLIAAYDAIDNPQAAIEQTLELLDVDRHNLELYKKLAARLAGKENLAERVATTIVEAAPKEAEHHQALAELRQQQNRWQEAIAHWRQVAELRSLEPGGLLNLAAAQVHEKEFAEAQKTLEKLKRTEWPARFQDLRNRIQSLQQQIPMSK